MADYRPRGRIGRKDGGSNRLGGVKHVDVLTIGSPLKHICEHDYGDCVPSYESGRALDGDRWVNMRRVGDPIWPGQT